MKKLKYHFECDKCKSGFDIGEGKIFSPDASDRCDPFTLITTLCNRCYDDTKLNIMERLLKLQYKGWWIQVSPLASPGSWVCAIYKEVRGYWVTEETKSNFDTPKEAYEWAFDNIHKHIDL